MKLISTIRKRRFLLLLTTITISYIIFTLFFKVFPVKKPMCYDPIDVVYTWVNGSDPKFLGELEKYLENGDYSKERFDDKHELKFSLRSLEKYAPWINHVYIVTNGQIPHWLHLDYEKVTLVTHKEIFSNREDLPTFSSLAIEFQLHRIPELSNRFIYFNDDIFLGSPVHYDDFFTRSKGFYVYLAWPLPPCSIDCPWFVVGDGDCDYSCMNFECQMDGGDCKNTTKSNEKRDVFRFLHEKNNISQAVETFNSHVIENDRSRKRQDMRTDSATNSDTYIGSLRHTNRLLNLHYGYKARYTPAHAPILIDKKIMYELENKFRKEIAITSTHKIRKNDDLQYAFTYYYYLMNEKSEKTIGEIFQIFDTDSSGGRFSTWSDREIRTLLTKLYPLPLTYNIIEHFEELIRNCSINYVNYDATTDNFERYEGSRLPTISKGLIENCASFTRILRRNFGSNRKHKYTIVNNSHGKQVNFDMLNSNISDVVLHLDEIRSNIRKFVCLNDNLDENEPNENELIRAVLHDFYLSLFPNPSRFELDPNFRNRFLHIDELKTWKKRRFLLKIIVYLCAILLFYIICICRRK